ncbi:Protein disulfide-isomerase 5-1 [Turnera subulata]|uniref:Protein disulfide-isomerase 5-1 n=1 Tax=Turnera subulata TaxID=218843 RepID=A0A9Q0GAD5_9ROSI|nr:Protein disulfide-isomerase 5-1 [Turnera subulata]
MESRSRKRRDWIYPSSILILILMSLTLLSLSDAEVITLTPETFSDKVKEKDTAWFVKFCVPWCKHCKNLGTLWEDLGKAVEGADDIEIGEVDCGASKSVCSKVDIHSYPTFKLFYDGEEVVKYQGPRDVESLKAFVLDEAEKAAAKAELDNDKDL